MLGDFLDNLENHHILSHTAVTFGGNFCKTIGHVFNPKSGHTAVSSDRCSLAEWGSR